MSDRTLEKVSEYIKKSGIIEKGDRIIAGVSGGADSVCMLLMLLSMKESQKLDIIVAHVNHGIRGEEAERDADFVRNFCKRNDLIFELECADIPALSKQTGTTCEEAGRNFRYEYFGRLALKYGAKKIAVAHNSDDNAETVLFNIFRGSGIGGLKGILPSRDLKAADGNKYLLIRPVLVLSRAEIEAYLNEKGQDFCTDRTNSEDTYARNRLRNVILPAVKEGINANAGGHIESLSRQAALVLDFIEQETEKHAHIISPILLKSDESISGVCIDCVKLEKLHGAIQRSLLRKAFEMASGRLKDVAEVHIELIAGLLEKQSGRKLSLPYGIIAVREYDKVLLLKDDKNVSSSGFCIEGASECKINFRICDRNLLPDEIPKEATVKWFDHEKTGNGLVVRTYRDGDYIIIGKERHRKSLSRFMIDKKIPLHERKNIPLLCSGSHVLWVVGYRQDDSCLITEATKKVLVAESDTVSG